MSAHLPKRRKLSVPAEDNSKRNSYTTDSAGSAAQADNTRLGGRSSIRSTAKEGEERSVKVALASGLYKSNFFKLQLDELLTELRPAYERQASRLQETLRKLKDVLERIADRPQKSIPEVEKELRSEHGIIIPFPEPRPRKEAKYLLSYTKPSNINVVGSFALKTGIKTTEPIMIDLVVMMPSPLFQDKDYVNHRYFHKRAYYIACLAAGIKESKELEVEMKFGLQNGDNLRPVIILEPSESERSEPLAARFQVRIITTIDSTMFPLSRTLPAKNNVRQNLSTDSPGLAQSLPLYNGALRAEATVGSYHKFLHSAVRKCDSFRDACILGRAWLRQRGFASSVQSGGFGGFEWAVTMALLLESGGPGGKSLLLKSYSSYQLFKATIQFISRKDLTTPSLFFVDQSTDIQFPAGRPVLYDGKRGTNLLYKMLPWSYALLRHEAGLTLAMLNESRDDNFENVFVARIDDPMLRFDRLLYLPSQGSCNIIESVRRQFTIYETITRALGNRVRLTSLSSQITEPWPVEAKPRPGESTLEITIGLVLDADNASRVVDHGPPAEQKEECAAFRAFWGEKAELRRFKDGSILESLVWSDHPSAASVVYQILSYILHRHFKVMETDMRYVGDEYDQKLRSVGSGVSSHSCPQFQLITNAFSSLEKALQNMDDVPLTIRHLAPASPFMRYTALEIKNTAGTIEGLVDVSLQFESSTRWPDDLVAIQMTKVAFLVKIGDALESAGAASSCRVGLENESSKISNSAFLEIVGTLGVSFRLRIHHDRELVLLERLLKDKDMAPRAREDVAYALSSYKRTFSQAPRLTQAIRGLCTRFPLLSPTIRLVKYWFSVHLFRGHIKEEVLEILTARVFTQPSPFSYPSSVMAGFLRTIRFISRWDWHRMPLIVDLGGDLHQNTIQSISTRFSAWRSVDPAMNSVALFIASDIDHDGVSWTQYEMPPKVVAGRMTALAKASMKLLQERGPNLDVSELFQTSLAPYDFVINLKLKAQDSRVPATAKERGAKATVTESFIRDLQMCFNQSILLFDGSEHGGVVAGLWKPQVAKVRDWNLKMGYSMAPRSTGNSKEEESYGVSINKAAILNEISRLGMGFIESIDVHDSS